MPEQPTHDDDTTSPYTSFGASGGGGTDGQYVFANLDEIDSIIADLEAEQADIENDDTYFQQAIQLATPPAEDRMSVGQVDAYRASLQTGLEHHRAVVAYVKNQLAKLRAARLTYTGTDTTSAEQLRNIPGAAT